MQRHVAGVLKGTMTTTSHSFGREDLRLAATSNCHPTKIGAHHYTSTPNIQLETRTLACRLSPSAFYSLVSSEAVTQSSTASTGIYGAAKNEKTSRRRRGDGCKGARALIELFLTTRKRKKWRGGSRRRDDGTCRLVQYE